MHDADGLAIWNGAGERIWRPLNNPTRIFVTSYLDDDPRGFGLSQRDRDFDHYLDGVGYEKRPTVWVEPLGGWGKGMVQLVEIPTDDEIHDNICAYWLPEKPTRAGDALSFRYRLHWLDAEPGFPADRLAKVVATRMGRGGEPRQAAPARRRPSSASSSWASPWRGWPAASPPEPVISVSRGSVSLVQMEPVPDGVPGHWRLFFDLAADGREPVEMRAFLRAGRRPADRDVALPVRAADGLSRAVSGCRVAAAGKSGLPALSEYPIPWARPRPDPRLHPFLP